MTPRQNSKGKSPLPPSVVIFDYCRLAATRALQPPLLTVFDAAVYAEWLAGNGGTEWLD